MSANSTHPSPPPALPDPGISSPPTPDGISLTKGKSFWLSIIALVACVLLTFLDMSAVSTALPTITADLNGGDKFVWVGSAYALSSTAIVPMTGGFADIFGRKPIMLISIAFFALGSALSGAAQNMNMMIAARVIQGLGGGCSYSMSAIIISDLVSLAERGLYQGLINLTWAVACAIGPPVAGGFSQHATWRWLFYLNLPITAVAFVLVFFCLNVRTPPGSAKEKFRLIDWRGNAIIVTGTTLAVTGLTLGGVRFPWSSAQVLVLLILGFGLVGLFILYEAKVPESPSIPFDVMSNRTTLGGLLTTLIHGMTSISIVYYLPVFFQACIGDSPLRSGAHVLPTSTLISASAIFTGVTIKVYGKYVPQNVLGWILTVVGFVLLSLLKADSPESKWVGYQIMAAAGTGIIAGASIFPTLAPLPLARTAKAVAFFTFLRIFAQTWGIAIPGAILQNQLRKRLPAAFQSQFAAGTQYAYAAIPKIKDLAEPLRTDVRVAFAASLTVIWQTMIGISGLGALMLFLVKEVPMAQRTDATYGLSETGKQAASGSDSGSVLAVDGDKAESRPVVY